MFNPRHPRRHRGAFGLVSSVMASLLLVSCADSARAGPPGATLGSKVAAPQTMRETAETSRRRMPQASWAGDEVIPAPRALAASAAEIEDAAAAVVGPTNDVVGQMNRLVAFPDLPIPARADVIEFRADTRQTLDGTRIVTTSEVAFAADGTVARMVSFFEDELAEVEGLVPSGRLERDQDGVIVQLLEYELPGGSGEPERLALEIRPSEALGDRSRSRVDLRYVATELRADGAPVAPFVAWVAGLPLPADGVVTGAGIQTSSVGRDSLHYSLTMTYERKDPPAVAEELRAALPADGFAVEQREVTDDETDNWVFLTSSFFDDARVTIHDGTIGGRASTLLSVEARVGLDH